MKSLSLVLIVSQIFACSAVWASDGSQAVSMASPELTFVTSAIELQGQKLSMSEKQIQIQSLLANYLAAAPVQGQQDRLEKALSSVGVFTPAQAAAFMADSQVAASRTTTSASMAQEAVQLANLHPIGAQFSGCDLGDPAMIVVAPAATMVVLAGLYLRLAQGSRCSSIVDGQHVKTYCGGIEYPHAGLGDDLMIAGGVALGISALIAVLVNENC